MKNKDTPQAQKKQAILEAVRKANPQTKRHKEISLYPKTCIYCMHHGISSDDTCDVGSPLRLEHLLRADSRLEYKDGEIRYEVSCCGYSGCGHPQEYESSGYDLTLTLEENLDNPELCDFLYPLLCND